MAKNKVKKAFFPEGVPLEYYVLREEHDEDSSNVQLKIGDGTDSIDLDAWFSTTFPKDNKIDLEANLKTIDMLMDVLEHYQVAMTEAYTRVELAREVKADKTTSKKKMTKAEAAEWAKNHTS